MPVQRVPINFSVQSKEYTAKQLNAQTCKNWYGTIDKDGKFQLPLFPFPGSLLWSSDASSKSVRCLYSLNETLYGVVDNNFRIYDDLGGFTNIGVLNTSGGRVTMMANDTQVMLSDGKDGYIYQLSASTSHDAGSFFKIQGATSKISAIAFNGSGINDLSIGGNYTGTSGKNYVIQIDGSATSYIDTPIFTGTGVDDLVPVGSYKASITKDYKVQIDGITTAYIGEITFKGTGFDNMSTSGTYTGLTNKVYKVEIDSEHADADTFRWSNNGGSTWVASLVPITGAAQLLESGISVVFATTSGHIKSSYWQFTAYIASATDKFKWSDTGGLTWNAQQIVITGNNQELNDGVFVKFLHTATHTMGNYWTFRAHPGGITDSFRWSNDNGNTWISSNILITGGVQILEYGLTAAFLHAGGHSLRDEWRFSTSVDSSFYAPLISSYLDTYGVYPKQRSKVFYVAQSEDFSRVSALNYAQANSMPDNLVAILAVNQELLMFCEKHIEVWVDVGASPFPFQRRPNLAITYGCAAPYSLAIGGNNTCFWLGRNSNGGNVVLSMRGYEPSIISNEALNQQLMEYTDWEDAFGFIMEWQGHIFYFLTFPAHDVTWVYDVLTDRWQQRTTRRLVEHLNPNQYTEGRYLANCHVYHQKEHYIGDWQSGNIYKVAQDCYKDNDANIICETTTAPLNIDLDRFSVYSIQIDFEAATSLATGQGSIPQMMLRISKDGRDFGKEIWRSLNPIGEFQKRVKWNKLGTGRNFVCNLRCSDPVYRVLFGAVADIERCSP